MGSFEIVREIGFRQVESRPLPRDRRSFELLLSRQVVKAYERYIALLKKLCARKL